MPSIFTFQGQAYIENIFGIDGLQIVVDAGKGREIVAPRESVVDGGDSTKVVGPALPRIVGEQEKLGRKGITEAAVHRLIR